MERQETYRVVLISSALLALGSTIWAIAHGNEHLSFVFIMALLLLGATRKGPALNWWVFFAGVSTGLLAAIQNLELAATPSARITFALLGVFCASVVAVWVIKESRKKPLGDNVQRTTR